jgi:hypothetical protein
LYSGEAAERLSVAACGPARLDTLQYIFDGKTTLKIAAVAGRRERFVGLPFAQDAKAFGISLNL